MQYVVSTIWTHPAEMDKDKMREVQGECFAVLHG